MIARVSTVVSVALAALSLGAQAATVNDVSPALSNPLEARGGLCCALAIDNKILQTVCQHMIENCGGWGNCVQGNDNQWCRYCIVNHPEDEACLHLTWPPVDPAPVGKRDENDATMAPAERDVSKETYTGSKEVQKRAIHTDHIQTSALTNQAQSYARSFGLVTIRIIVSAVNVVTYSIQNAGVRQAAYEILDLNTGWHINGNVDGGEVIGGHVPNQALGKGGDNFELDFVT
ncbi:hypothetical protein CKAH01_05882 [Colletotrichum kahawae]|uniref:Uncharacterized protein n=1 Tax=Colletotrichum kahawae TaxID=34407 RepID=A0AAD9YDR5_COLKA|nr:hypothetical protein CKAH01_05882 [Colletotrichum kahawae]